MMTKSALLIFMLSTSAFAQVCPQNRSDYFCLSPDMAPNSLIQEADFHEIASEVVGLFSSELNQKGYPFSLDARWESPFLGAGVSFYQERFSLMILGGTARIKDMSRDAFAALVCHELGHILGGAPYQQMSGSAWASLEGQSDFFAASVCLPRYFHSLQAGRAEVASRIEAAGFYLFKALSPHSTQTRDQPLARGKRVLPAVEKTLQGYPSVQCRYETFRNPSKRSSCWFAAPI